MLGLGPFGNCDCFPVSALVRKGTAEHPRAGAQLGTPMGPRGQGNTACTSLGAECGLHRLHRHGQAQGAELQLQGC